MTIFALVDCNNFYASCERVFNPKLVNQPVIILSNNDGCIVARSEEAKALNIPMAAPYFKYRNFCQKNAVQVFSSNYQLYGDMSARVMRVLNLLAPKVQIYSIDEAFLDLTGINNVVDFCINIRKILYQWLGIPVAIGIAPSKTLAKIAGVYAKKGSGVYSLMFDLLQEQHLVNFPVSKIWGIGKRSAIKLEQLNIKTAWQLKNSSRALIRRHFTVVGERIWYELNGHSCIQINQTEVKKSIAASRSFGSLLTEFADVQKTVVNHVVRAAQKLREQKSVACAILVMLTTAKHRPMPQYRNSIICHLLQPTAVTSELIYTAQQGFAKIFRPGFHYYKTGVVLLDLIDEAKIPSKLFNEDKVTGEKTQSLMKIVDQINEQQGNGTIFWGAQGIKNVGKMRRNLLSAAYTTDWQSLPRCYCN